MAGNWQATADMGENKIILLILTDVDGPDFNIHEVLGGLERNSMKNPHAELKAGVHMQCR